MHKSSCSKKCLKCLKPFGQEALDRLRYSIDFINRKKGLGSNIVHGLIVGWVEHSDIFCWVSCLNPTYVPAIFVLSAKPNKMAEDRNAPRFSILQLSVYNKTQRSDTIILGILAHFRHFRHFSGLSGFRTSVPSCGTCARSAPWSRDFPRPPYQFHPPRNSGGL